MNKELVIQFGDLMGMPWRIQDNEIVVAMTHTVELPPVPVDDEEIKSVAFDWLVENWNYFLSIDLALDLGPLNLLESIMKAAIEKGQR